MSPASESAAQRVLILTPTGQDAEMVYDRIATAGMQCEVCADLPALLAGISSGTGAALIALEALSPSGAVALLEALEAQPPWSDVPVFLLVEARTMRRPRVAADFFERANVTLLQRPLPIQLLLSSLRAALRARLRQYEMRDLYEELERAVQLSDMFVGILGHDLRTPLGAIMMGAEVIIRSSSDPRALSSAGRIVSSADRMSRMIEQLLDFARARRGGGIPLNIGRVHLGELCRRAIQEFQDAEPELNLQCEAVGDLSGVWDADRLAQIWSNLVGNAVQYGTKGKPVTIEVDGTDESTVRLSVHNFGTVPPEQLPRLFEAFKRAAAPVPSRASGTGLGLGLFIAREIARAHGGNLVVHSADDRTTFEVSLPREARPVDTAALTKT